MIFQNMEPAQTQLARPLPPLCLKAGTSNPSIYSDHLALTFMSEWHSFREDALQVFREAGVSHNVPFHDETELYTVGNELGVSGRFVRNLCDPVMKALEPLPSMASIRFADFQAISTPGDVVPDVCLGLVAVVPTPDNVHLVGEVKTPWTIPDAYIHLNRPNTSYHLEPLIGLPSPISNLLFSSEHTDSWTYVRTACCSNARVFASLWIFIHLQLFGFRQTSSGLFFPPFAAHQVQG